MNIEITEAQFIAEVIAKVRQAQYEASKAVNVHLINLYWELGKAITDKQVLGWGKAIVPTLSAELKKEFPGITGFSATNLWYMAQFYTEYNGEANLQPLVGEISWTKHLVILSKCKESKERQFYTISTKKYGWTKDVLTHQIENKTFEKYLLNQTNFDAVLPDHIKKQAYLAVKDHYNFELLELSDQHSEYELEQALIKNIRQFLLEIGPDFSFIGNQYKLPVSDKEYKIDLLLFHRKLQSLIAVDLKIGEFEPEHKGKMEFYLTVLNDQMKLPHENPAIGIIICKSKDRTIVEYALKSATLPIGVSTYSTTNTLPEAYKDLLAATTEIASKLQQFLDES